MKNEGHVWLCCILLGIGLAMNGIADLVNIHKQNQLKERISALEQRLDDSVQIKND